MAIYPITTQSHAPGRLPDHIPAKRDEEPAPYMIRGNPVLSYLVPDFRRDDVWMPIRVPFRVFIGDTILIALLQL